MATTKIRSSSIEDGQVANADLSATVAVTGGQIADDAVTLAKMADGTQGDTLYYGVAGAPTLLAKPGTPAGEVLTFATSATAPTWAAGGKVLHLLEDNLNTTVSSTSTSYVASGLTITITPKSTSSKFLLSLNGGVAGNTTLAQECLTTFYVGGSEVADTGPYEIIRMESAPLGTGALGPHSSQCLHLPSTVSATTYAVFYKASANTAYFNTTPARVVFTVMEFAS